MVEIEIGVMGYPRMSGGGVVGNKIDNDTEFLAGKGRKELFE